MLICYGILSPNENTFYWKLSGWMSKIPECCAGLNLRCTTGKIQPLFTFSFVQGERVAELILHHARANECKDVLQFKKEMGQLVDQALSNTLSLGKVPARSCDIFIFMQCWMMTDFKKSNFNIIINSTVLLQPYISFCLDIMALWFPFVLWRSFKHSFLVLFLSTSSPATHQTGPLASPPHVFCFYISRSEWVTCCPKSLVLSSNTRSDTHMRTTVCSISSLYVAWSQSLLFFLFFFSLFFACCLFSEVYFARLLHCEGHSLLPFKNTRTTSPIFTSNCRNVWQFWKHLESNVSINIST